VTEGRAAQCTTRSQPASARSATPGAARSPSTSFARAGTLPRLPLEKSSTITTGSPRASSASATWLPMKPAPPVTTTAFTARGGTLRPAVPPDEAAQALLEADARVVAQLGARAADVGEGARHVARLRRLPLDARLLAGRAPDRGHQLLQAHRARLAEVVDAVALAAVERLDHAVEDVVHVGVIALAAAVAVERQLLAALQQPHEFVDGHLGPLPRAVDGEEAQAGDVHAVQVREDVAGQLVGALGRGVGRDGPADVVVLVEGHLLVAPVDRAAAAQNEARDARL